MSIPTREDVQIVLKLYDLRREPVMRESRSALLRWVPSSLEDLLSVTQLDHPMNAAFRQVASYFEMAYGFARRGATHAELLVDNCGEGLLLFTKVSPFLEGYRAATSPRSFSNAEWAATSTEAGKTLVELFRKRIAAMKESR